MSKKTLSKKKFDAKVETVRISKFIKENVAKAGAKGLVIGISGGVDSAVSAALGVKAMGRQKVLGLLLFENDSIASRDYDDAKTLISELGIKSKQVSISPIIDAFKNSLSIAGLSTSKITLGNIKARCRMVVLYAFANQNNLLVLGTGDRSEEEIGYFTKYGDGGVDFHPLAHLYKSEVKLLGRYLGVPSEITTKPSSPHLWKGHQATDEIPVDYPSLDKILTLLYDSGMKAQDVAKELGVSRKLVSDIMLLHENSNHKREAPPQLH
jgi:NAD+ synthase